VESLSGEDDDDNSKGGGGNTYYGQSTLVNLKMNGDTLHSPKHGYDNINQSRNPFDEEEDSSSKSDKRKSINY